MRPVWTTGRIRESIRSYEARPKSWTFGPIKSEVCAQLGCPGGPFFRCTSLLGETFRSSSTEGLKGAWQESRCMLCADMIRADTICIGAGGGHV